MVKAYSISSPDKRNTVRRFFKTALSFIVTDPSAEQQSAMNTNWNTPSPNLTSSPAAAEGER
ncbi:hypothetical protein [Desulfovibrio psychrotolerans]|uniref:Uncharacterized protein n=1 Tax=Desulfovibrio psychrotolerans TaxID=415242 RepID=A0A7J0BUZ1_9BACT|nr:hypothetical protein [Desulfovibrio psychrotolerans]GFM37526.1 hypothetical protein DSM19430T_22100 [Desulfovibrio psychrotolerans]